MTTRIGSVVCGVLFSGSLVTGSLVAGCTSSGDRLTGERADGLTVSCEVDEDENFECETEDDDDECESWEDGGSAFVLWPPNHKMVAIDVADCVGFYDECTGAGDPNNPIDLGDWVITSVTSDEPVEVGAGGDGNTADFDIYIGDNNVVELRSERQGKGDGRVYRIWLADDLGFEFGCEVHVPHDQGPFGGAIDSGEAVRVLAP